MEDKNSGWDSLEFSEIVDRENTISPTESESSCHSTESSPAISAILKLRPSPDILKLRPIMHKRKGVPCRSPFFWDLSQCFLKNCSEYLLVFFFIYLNYVMLFLIWLNWGVKKLWNLFWRRAKESDVYSIQAAISLFFFFFLLFALFQLEKSYQDNFILYFLLFEDENEMGKGIAGVYLACYRFWWMMIN